MSELVAVVLVLGSVLSAALAVALAVFVVSRVFRQNKELVEMALVEQKQISDARGRAAKRIEEKKKREIERSKKTEESHGKEDMGFSQPTHMM